MSPLPAGWWGGGGMGIASPYCTCIQFGCYPLGAGRSREHRSGGHVASRATQQPRSQVYPCPSPGRGITASRWRFGMASRCSAYGAQGQPGTSGREGDKSVEAVPRPWLTFNLAQMHRGVDKIGPRSAGYPFPGFQYSPPRKPSEIPPSGGFRFVGPRIQFRDYLAIYSIAATETPPSEKAPSMAASEGP